MPLDPRASKSAPNIAQQRAHEQQQYPDGETSHLAGKRVRGQIAPDAACDLFERFEAVVVEPERLPTPDSAQSGRNRCGGRVHCDGDYLGGATVVDRLVVADAVVCFVDRKEALLVVVVVVVAVPHPFRASNHLVRDTVTRPVSRTMVKSTVQYGVALAQKLCVNHGPWALKLES